MFPTDRFIHRRRPPAPSDIAASIRYWDKAGTDGTKGQKTGAQTAGVLMHRLKDGRFFIAHCQCGHWAALERERRIKAVAESDGRRDPHLRRAGAGLGRQGERRGDDPQPGRLAGHRRPADRRQGDARQPYAAQVQGGNVWVLRASWNLAFIDEHQAFPVGQDEGQVDAAAAAFNLLNAAERDRSSDARSC